MKKRILMLGGSYFQIPAIQYAKEQGHHVITCDYLPDNPGHKYSDEYYNISTTDVDSVLKLADALRIDGIVSYASDPAAPTQAYVAEKLGLPGNPSESVDLLCHKDRYRSFLEKHAFSTPKSNAFSKYEEAAEYCREFSFPVVVKPVDSSGSKGITSIYEPGELSSAFAKALSFSRSRRVIIEEFVVKEGYQISGDGFVYNGNLCFRCFGNEHYNNPCNPLIPIGESFPYIGSPDIQEKAHAEVQRLVSLLGINTGALNLEICMDKDDDVYLMEVGPRNGGSCIPEATRCCTGVDLIKYTIDAALGFDCSDLKMEPPRNFCATYNVHSLQDGILQEITFSPEIQSATVINDIWAHPGDEVKCYNGSNNILGIMVLKFESQDQMLDCMEHIHKHVVVHTV